MAKRARNKSSPSAGSQEKRQQRTIHDTLASRPGPLKGELAWVGAVFAAAVAVRLVFFFINKNTNPLFYHPVLDALFHHEWAQQILAGDFWGDEVFFRAPFYPYLLAFLYKLGGTSIAFAVLVQHIIGSLSAVLVYLLARRYFTRRVSVAAGIVAAFYWPLIYFEGDLLFETLIVFLDLALLLVLAIAIERRSTALLAAAGLVLGLSAITRPSILILVPVLPVVFRHAAERRKDPGAGRAWIRQTAIVVAGSLVFILPVLVRNFAVGRDFVPIASQGGVNFYIGNNPQSNGSQAMVPGARADLYGTYQGAIELAEKDAGRKLKPSEVSTYYTRKALDFIVTEPAGAARLFFKKLYLFWAGIERSNDKYMQFFWKRYGLGRFPFPGFWLVGPFALLGGALLIRRWKEYSLLYLFVLSYMIGVVIFFVNGRFRLPVAPVLIIFASYAFFHLLATARTNRAGLFPVVGLLAVFAFAVDYDYVAFRGVRSIDEAVSHYEIANAYLKMGDKDRALSHFEEAAEMQRKYPTRSYAQIGGTIDFNIGMIYWERGLYSRAIEALERIPDADPRSFQAKALLGDSYVKKGRAGDAVALYAGMLRKSPDDPRVLFGLGVALRGTGDLERSRQVLEEILQKHRPPDGSVNLELARTLELKGDIEGAVRNYEAAAAKEPQRRDATLELARLCKKTGNRDRAAELLTELRTAFPDDRAIEMELNALRSGRP
jgi:tetratricopeptide (TPR) repeat protein